MKAQGLDEPNGKDCSIPKFPRSDTQGATAWITLGLIGLVLIYNGTLDVPDIDRGDQILVICCCLAGGVTSLILTWLVLAHRINSPLALEASITTGLVAGIVVNSVTGAVWPGTLWITCGYTMVLTITAGVTLRNRYVYGSMLIALFAAWLASVGYSDQDLIFQSDANTLVIVSGLVSIATFALLKRERSSHVGLTDQLRDQLDYDSLTGALNRNGLLARLDGLSDDDGVGFWCAYVDVDFFKSINDREGHDYGDQVLRGISSGLVEFAGSDALVSRWGGDEFVVLAEGPPPVEERFEQAVSASLSRNGLDATLTIGITSSPEVDRKGSDEIIGRADRRMYERRDAIRAASDL